MCALLGGTPLPFPVYGSSMRRDITPADEAARLVALREPVAEVAHAHGVRDVLLQVLLGGQARRHLDQLRTDHR